MELQTPLRFHATVLCWTQGSEVQKIEVSRSFAHNNPYLDFLQGANSAIEYPHMGFDRKSITEAVPAQECARWHSFAISTSRTSIMGRDTQIRTFIFTSLLT